MDNEPLAALVQIVDHSAIVIIPLDARKDEAAVRQDLAANLERLGRPDPTALPELLVLTPSRSLGSFLSGTLDFRPVRSQALMRMGYCDTMRRLARSTEGRGAADVLTHEARPQLFE